MEPAQAMTDLLRWHVRLDPSASLIHLELRAELQPGERFSMPAWIPGSYLVREFVRGVQDLRITRANGAAVPTTKTSKNEWRVDLDAPAECVLSYSVYGRELSVRTAHVDSTHAFFNGANAFMRFERLSSLPHAVEIEVPSCWTAFVSLPEQDGAFVARDFVHLADTVFEVGPHEWHAFEIDGVPHRFVFWGDAALPIDLPKLESDTIALVRQNMATLDAPLPYERYDFIFHITPSGRGGLEHRDSTTLAVSWDSFETKDGYLDMLTLIAHEHLHAWNGRRMTPASLAEPDFNVENYVDELWVVEGFTSYYDELNTLLAGRMTLDAWLSRQAKSLTALQKTFGRTRQALTESSFDAWIRLYRPYEHTRNQTVSYYLKGALVALAIDLRLRASTGGAHGLSDVVRTLWQRWTERQLGYTTHEVLALISELGGSEVGTDARAWVTTTTPPPFEELFASHGLLLDVSSETNSDFGFEFQVESGSAVISSVNEARADAIGALSPGDEIIALDGRRVRGSELRARLQAICAEGPTETSVLLFRLGRQREVTIQVSAVTDFILRVDDHAPEEAKNALQRLIG